MHKKANGIRYKNKNKKKEEKKGQSTWLLREPLVT